MLKSSRGVVRFGSPVVKLLLQNHIKRIWTELTVSRRGVWTSFLRWSLTLDGSSLEGRIYGTTETQTRRPYERMIQAQVKSARTMELAGQGNPEGGNTLLSCL